MDRAPAIARLLEMAVRSAYVRSGADERHLTDWPVLRFLVQAGNEARTRAGLQRFLGVDDKACAAIVDRLLMSGLEQTQLQLNLGDSRFKRLMIPFVSAGQEAGGHDTSPVDGSA